jgi:hypothetical protein
MKLKALLLACAVAGFTASFALADDGGHDGHHGKHHEHHGTTTTMTTSTTTATTTTTPAGCTRVELRGTFASVSASSFTFMVTKAETGDDEDNDDNDDDDNAPASPNLVGQTLTIAVDANTEVSFKATGTLTGPNVGDSAKVEANMCGSPATFTALSVKAKGKMAAGASNSRKLKSKHH